MPQAAATPISGRRQVRRTPHRCRQSFSAYYRWLDDALRHRADGYRLLDYPLLGLPGVRRLSRMCFDAAPSPRCMWPERSCSRPPSEPRPC